MLLSQRLKEAQESLTALRGKGAVEAALEKAGPLTAPLLANRTRVLEAAVAEALAEDAAGKSSMPEGITLKAKVEWLTARLDHLEGEGTASAALGAMPGTLKDRIEILAPLVNAAQAEQGGQKPAPAPPIPAPAAPPVKPAASAPPAPPTLAAKPPLSPTAPPAATAPDAELAQAQATLATYEAVPKNQRTAHYCAHQAELDAALLIVEKAQRAEEKEKPATARSDAAFATIEADAAAKEFRESAGTGNRTGITLAAENLITKYEALTGRARGNFLRAQGDLLTQAAELIATDEN